MDDIGSDDEFHDLLRAHCKSLSMTKFVGGVQLVKAMEDEDYVPIFSGGRKVKRRKTTVTKNCLQNGAAIRYHRVWGNSASQA